MLREIAIDRLPCSRWINRCITLSTFVACTWIGCWSVEGQTAPKDNPAEPAVTTDSQVVPASHEAPSEMFSQPKTQPWDTVGNRSGYLNIRVNRLLKHPDLKFQRRMIESALDSVLLRKDDASPSLKKFGLGLDDCAQIQLGFLLHHIEEAKVSRIILDITKVEITAVKQVDWRSLINALDLSKISIFANHVDKIREQWLESAQKTRSNVFCTSVFKMTSRKIQQPSQTKKAIWDAVSGGVATVVYDLPQIEGAIKVYEGMDEQELVHQAESWMTAATEAVAWGIDLSPDYKSCRIRFAAVPQEDVLADDLVDVFEAVREAFQKVLRTASEGQDCRDEEIVLWKHVLEQSKKLKVSVVKGEEINGEKTEAYLLVEGECSADVITRWGLAGFFDVLQ